MKEYALLLNVSTGARAQDAVTRFEKQCPHCGRSYSNGSVRGRIGEEKMREFIHESARRNLSYGKPVIQCRGCGKEFFDPDVIEWELETIEPNVDVYLADREAKTKVPILVFFCLGAFFVLEGAPVPGYIMAGIAVLMLGFKVLYKVRWKANKAKLQEFLAGEKKASKERLGNTEYACFLKEMGVNVPKRFLPKGYRAAVNTETENADTGVPETGDK